MGLESLLSAIPSSGLHLLLESSITLLTICHTSGGTVSHRLISEQGFSCRSTCWEAEAEHLRSNRHILVNAGSVDMKGDGTLMEATLQTVVELMQLSVLVKT